MKSSVTIILFIASLFLSQLTTGQGFEIPVITYDYHKIINKNSSQSRVQNNTPLSLPFWDDFSQSRMFPDTLKWEKSKDVAISPTDGINNMSFNVAVFNGIDSIGVAHSSVLLQEGDTDILTSCAIDLSSKSASDNIYLSFFYEKKGNGEIPNDDDGIRVEYMNEDSVWVANIWSVQGEDIIEVDSFYQVLLPVDKDEFFSDKYRFRIVATGRQTGLFDTWLVDYVYLNEGRSANDKLVGDRTFTKPISSPFKDYYSLPIEHFLTNSNNLLGFMGSQYVQIESTTEVQGYELNVIISYVNNDETTGETSNQQLATNGPNSDNTDDFNGLTGPYDRRDFEVQTLLDVSNIPAEAVYAEIQAELLGSNWDDGMLDIIDLNINDTVRNTFILDNYYAYDDGSAERGAGVNNTESQLAYKFGAAMPDSITALDIYFPKTIQEVQFGKQVRLKVWENSDGLPGKELFTKNVLIQKNDTLNNFYRFEFEEKIAIVDTFFIGWEQLSDVRIFVGLDKNTNSSERIFFNITGDWEPNNNDITGSLMLRPVFGEIPDVDPDTVVAGLDKQKFESSIKLYPNPTTGSLNVQGDYDHLDILSPSGRILTTIIIKDGQNNEVNLYGLPSGMYIVRLRKDGITINKKIILNQ